MQNPRGHHGCLAMQRTSLLTTIRWKPGACGNCLPDHSSQPLTTLLFLLYLTFSCVHHLWPPGCPLPALHIVTSVNSLPPPFTLAWLHLQQSQFRTLLLAFSQELSTQNLGPRFPSLSDTSWRISSALHRLRHALILFQFPVEQLTRQPPLTQPTLPMSHVPRSFPTPLLSSSAICFLFHPPQAHDPTCLLPNLLGCSDILTKEKQRQVECQISVDILLVFKIFLLPAFHPFLKESILFPAGNNLFSLCWTEPPPPDS